MEIPIININIIYEDNHLLVVEKPVNVLSQGDSTGDPDMLTLLKRDIKCRYSKPGDVYLGMVHRLDRPVGGVMVFARTSKAASRLSVQIRKNEFRKTYLAVIHGVPPLSKGHLEHYLVKDDSTNTVHVVSECRETGKRAVLDYATLATVKDLCLVKVNLLTGRPHQIRVQFSTISCPLFGDQKYGAGRNKRGQQLALWSSKIICMHPTLKEEMVFKCLPPDVYPWNLYEFNDIYNAL